jgi:periplasmic divalent cation tolerance protein
MDDQIVLAIITTPSNEVARQIAFALVEQKLAACVNILPKITSIYSWEGELHEDGEVMLFCKTRAALFSDYLVPAVQKMHPYEVPEIIALPVSQGLPAYLDWVMASCQTPIKR